MSKSIRTHKLHIPNVWNCIQSALYEIEQTGNIDHAIHYLEGAKNSLRATNLITSEDSK